MADRLTRSGSAPDFSHPIFDPVRPWLERIADKPSLGLLNSFAEERNLRTESGKAIRFVAPAGSDPYYEVHLFETGSVQTRPENLHDLFNALAWLAFPKTKARINALHAAEIPREQGKRGRLRDMLTLVDEGGVIVECADPVLEEMVRGFRWREIFWVHRADVLRAMRIQVLGHAVLEMALAPWPGVTCKAIFVPDGTDPDRGAAAWLDARRMPPELAALPIFGYPGWFTGNERAEFYADERFFRPFRRELSRRAT